MKYIVSKYFITLAFLTALLLFFVTTAQANLPSEIPSDINLEDVQPDKVDSVLAKLTDEQVRNLLITELSKDIPAQSSVENSPGGLFKVAITWLHIFDEEKGKEMGSRIHTLYGYSDNVSGDLANLFLKIGDGKSTKKAWKNFALVLVLLLVAFVAELLFKASTRKFRSQFIHQDIPELNGYMRTWAGLIHKIPEAMDLTIFAISSFILVLISPLADTQSLRFLFLAIVFCILLIRLGILLSNIFCSPDESLLRLLPLNNKTARTFHIIMLITFINIGISMSFMALIRELGMPENGMVLMGITVGTIFMLPAVALVLHSRRPVAEYILASEHFDTGSNWVFRQFASLWHVAALIYLLIVWLLFLYHQLFGIIRGEGGILLSLVVVPLSFILLDRLGQWVVQMTISALKIYPDDEEAADLENQDELTSEQKERLLMVRVGRFVRLVIILALGAWVMMKWGYNVPYAATTTKIVFRSLVTMAFALFFWTIISGYVERKIKEDEPEEETTEDQDDEWGAAAQRGRSYTLLPMVRKFIGSVLVVIVTLIILSTIGIEIGPLLAGAGVVGLAIGFGAQKLVSDIFSGFFYLLDDAFRVGEYLEAGGVSGAVEGITLRNVMLRHHRGMLQIVPYSELGPITNYMRGGIVVKFNLEFPYDTDIDKVRKIIKKVGQAMLEDEEFGEDFIRPVKSQGVREITNSVMVIRVKFTAKPGTHFVIRREAYRRITEALAAKGIHYAHRKVIVEVPGAENADPQKIAEAGAAAGLAAMAEDEKKAKEGGGEPPSGMPGMS